MTTPFLSLDYEKLTLLLSKKKCKYTINSQLFFSDLEFIHAIQRAPSEREQINAIENLLLFLNENFDNVTETVDYLSACRPVVPATQRKFKKIIINFNGTGCPPYLRSAHEQYLMEHLGQHDTAIKNIPGVGINAQQSLISNLIDVSYADSLAERIQEALDYIREHADEECSIEIFGHSRGAVMAIIFARIVSQKYAQLKVIAHDPVPGDRAIPLVKTSYYEHLLDVSYFLPNRAQQTIEQILNDKNLAIRGTLMVPWRRDDNRPDFSLLAGAHVYDALYFIPVELAGFHSVGLYESTGIDYAVYFEKIPLVRSYLQMKNKNANQGHQEIDSQRDAIKSMAYVQYRRMVTLFTETQFVKQETIPAFETQLRQLRKDMLDELSTFHLAHSAVQKNPAYHARQGVGRRTVPAALNIFDDLGIDEAMYEGLERYSEPAWDLHSLVFKMCSTPSEVTDQDLLYLILYFVVLISRADSSDLLIENLAYNLSSEASYAVRVQKIGEQLGIPDLCQQIILWKNQREAQEIAQDMHQATAHGASNSDRDLWMDTAHLLLENNHEIESLLMAHAATKKMEKKPDSLRETLVSALMLLGLILGFGLGLFLTVSGVFTPFGVTFLSALTLGLVFGGAGICVGGVLSLWIDCAPTEVQDIPLDDLETKSRMTYLGQLGTHSNSMQNSDIPASTGYSFFTNPNKQGIQGSENQYVMVNPFTKVQ